MHHQSTLFTGPLECHAITPCGVGRRTHVLPNLLLFKPIRSKAGSKLSSFQGILEGEAPSKH